MGFDRARDGLRQLDRDGVSYQAPYDLEMNRIPGCGKLIFARETLQQCPFSQRKRAILLGMAEATVSEAIELRRDRGRRFVPLHPSVYRRVSSACIDSV